MKQKIEQKIYHYTDENGLFGILESKNLWLINLEDMKDPTDRVWASVILKKVIKKSNKENAKILKRELKAKNINIDQILSEHENIPFYSASFCKNNKNKFLWKYYGKKGKGFCIEFNASYLIEQIHKIIKKNYNSLGNGDIADSDLDICFRNLIYNFSKKNLETVLRDTKRLLFNDNIMNLTNEDLKNWVLLTFDIYMGTIKKRKYHRENETRLLFQDKYTNPCDDICLIRKENYKNSMNQLGLNNQINENKKNIIKLDLSTFFNEQLITKIIVGSKIKNNKKILYELKKKMTTAGIENVLIVDRKNRLL